VFPFLIDDQAIEVDDTPNGPKIQENLQPLIIFSSKVPLDKGDLKMDRKSLDKDENDSFHKLYNKEIKVN
jgi:hypothetical protein